MTPTLPKYKRGALAGCYDSLLLSPYPGENWCERCHYKSYCSVHKCWEYQTANRKKEVA